MALVNRPFAGTWAPNRRTIVQYTPDALVYLNGDTSLPGCRICHHNIDVQQFVTSVSVDSGVDPGASSATVSLSIPRSYGDSLMRDGNTLLRAGLEVHIYFRGYFPMRGMASTTAGDVDLGDVPQYPYYPSFHGVVTAVNHERSGGFTSASLTCAGMLHFWSHIQFSRDGSFFGARPVNSNVRPTLTGHPLTGRSPHSIIYSLYRDTAGAAAGVGYALSSRTNYGAVSSVTRDSLYALTIRYWERRFRDRMYGLRMHGASGQLFTASQQAYVALHHGSGRGGSAQVASHSPATAQDQRDPLARDPARLLNLRSVADGRVLRQVDLNLLPSLNGNSMGLSMEQMHAFAWDLGAQGQVNLFETTYESKLDIATAVTNLTGFEFYQDVDGDLVFKPPLYNLDTSSSRVYRIEPADIISMSFSENEPEATYVVVKGSQFQNTQGVVSESEWGCRSTYVDYKLVAQFGWREASVESSYYSNARSAFFVGVAHMDKINVGVNGCTVTIPLRPELRPGYPVYISSIDCHYYVQSLSHAFQFGGQCTTTLTLTARRRKFLPPGVLDATTGGDLPGVDLSRTDLSPLALQALDPGGVPRLVGMPNVVMALDPQAINPMFSHLGFDAEEAGLTRGRPRTQAANRELFLTNFIQMLWERGILGAPAASRNAERSGAAGGSGYWYRASPTQEWAVAVGDHYSTFTVSFADLRTALDQFIGFRSELRDGIARLQRELAGERRASSPNAARITQLEQNISQLQANLSPGAGYGGAGTASDLASLETATAGAAEILRAAGVRTAVGRPGDTPGRGARSGGTAPPGDRVSLLGYLIRQIQVAAPASVQRDVEHDPTGTINTTANLLELLNDRKASMSLTTPGHYRYYSASHPDPNQQGYAPISREEEVGAASSTTTAGATPSVTGVQEITRTRMTPAAAARYLREAYTQLTGSPPSNRVLSVLLGQWAIESGTGTRMYNFNYGGVKIPRRGWEGGRVQLPTHETVNGQRVATQAWFQAYGTAEEGARAYLQNIIRNYSEALAAVDRTGNPRAYGEYMGRYHTGDNAEYAQDVAHYAADRAPAWIREAGIPEDGAAATPAPGETAARTPVPIPEVELRTTVLRRASNVEGVPPERAAQYVTASTHTPTNGLEVRTFTSSRPRVVPTQQIRTLTFEARSYTRVTRGSTVVFRAGSSPASVVAFLQSCLAGNASLEGALTQEMTQRAGAAMSSVGGTPAALVRAAAPPTSALRGPNGPLSTPNISNGRANEFADPAPATVGTTAVAGVIVRNKARALLREVTEAYRTQIQTALERLRALPATTAEVPPAVVGLLSGWRGALAALYAGGMPSALPFRTETGAREITSRTNTFSPVFPVSDERGYEHYGSFQYGRGLSIEPGGNYERLMAADPLRYADPAAVERLVASLVRHPEGGLTNPEVEAALRSAATGIQNSPGESVALEALTWGEGNPSDRPNGDRTALIASGLRNYIMSDRDAVTKLPVSNAAYNLTDLQPGRAREDVCACRGAEADLLLAAYMAGSAEGASGFITVEGGADEASRWVAGQIAAAAEPWALAQEALRGTGGSGGQRTLFDSIGGLNSIGSSFTGAANASSRELEDVINRGNRDLAQREAAVATATRRLSGR